MHHSYRKTMRGLLLPLAVLAVAGCATPPERPVPTRQIQAAEAAIVKAEQAAGRTAPAVVIAREKLAGARRAVEQKHMVLAERSAEQARADAELATARAEADRARDASMAVERALLPESNQGK
jgi:hypothetical protein